MGGPALGAQALAQGAQALKVLTASLASSMEGTGVFSFVTFFITYKFEVLTLEVILQYSKVNNRNKVISELLILRLLQTPLQLFYLSIGFQPFLALPSL